MNHCTSLAIRKSNQESPPDVVSQIFESILGRQPTQDESESYCNFLIANPYAGTDLALHLFGTNEYLLSHRVARPCAEARTATREIFNLVLGRDPEEAALDAYSAALESGLQNEIDVVRNLMQLDEYVGRMQPRRDKGDARTVTREIFNLVLGRDPEEAALDAYSAALESGLQNEIDVVRNLMQLDEYVGRMQPRRDKGDARTVTREIFNLVLGRDPEEAALDAYSAALESGLQNEIDVVRNLMQLDEYVGRMQPRRDKGDARSVTREIFNLVLGRDPEEAALDAYSAALESGLQNEIDVVRDLMQLDEYVCRMQPRRDKGDARAVAREIFNLVLGRDPEEAALDAYSAALESGQQNEIDVIRNLMHLNEYVGRMQPRRDKGDARAVTREIFSLVLGRDPEEAALDAYSAALETGLQSEIDVVRILMQLEEFASHAVRRRDIASYIVKSIFNAMLPTQQRADSIEPYIAAFQNGLTLKDLVSELAGSNEYKASRLYDDQGRVMPTQIHAELLQKTQMFIVEIMRREGCSLSLPPQPSDKHHAVDSSRLEMLIETLGHLALEHHSGHLKYSKL